LVFTARFHPFTRGKAIGVAKRTRKDSPLILERNLREEVVRVPKPLLNVPYRGPDMLLLALFGGLELFETPREEHAREVQHVERRREVVIVVLLLLLLLVLLSLLSVWLPGK